MAKKSVTNDPYKSTVEVYNQLGKEYIKQTFKRLPKDLPKFIKLLPKNATVLDIGSGAGRDSKVFSEKGFKVVGIDASKVFIAEAKQYAPKATFKLGDVRKLKFPANSFDAIWAQAVLLHVKRQDVSKVLKNFYKILKPNGIVHIMVKEGKGMSVVKEKLSGFNERLFTFFEKDELIKLVSTAGFDPIYDKISSDDLGRKEVKWITVWGRKSGSALK